MSDSEKFHTITSVWSDNIEKILKELGESCLGYKWMNMFAAKSNEFKYNTLMYISIVIGPLAGVLSAVSSDNEMNYLPVIVTAFSFLSGVISTIIKFSEFGEKSVIYKNTAAKYASLESNIRRQLSLTRDDRVNAGEYLEWISKSYDDLFTSSPFITDSIYQQWVKYAKENDLSIPKELGTIVIEDSHKIEQLTSLKSIEIQSNPVKDTVRIDAVKDPVKNEHSEQKEPEVTHKRQRTLIDGSVADLEKYSDGKMRYEMARLFRMK